MGRHEEVCDTHPREELAHVRERLSACAHPRRSEFVDDLPGKIRRAELREGEAAG